MAHCEVKEVRKDVVVIDAGSCPLCGKQHEELVVNKKGWVAWKNGTMIQRALPELTPAQREVLISGICDECYEKTFGGDDDEADEA